MVMQQSNRRDQKAGGGEELSTKIAIVQSNGIDSRDY